MNVSSNSELENGFVDDTYTSVIHMPESVVVSVLVVLLFLWFIGFVGVGRVRVGEPGIWVSSPSSLRFPQPLCTQELLLSRGAFFLDLSLPLNCSLASALFLGLRLG
jgi:hypothetical protein